MGVPVNLLDAPETLLMDKPMSPREVAEFLSLNVATVYSLIQKHQIPAVRIGGKWFIRCSDVKRLLEGKQ